MPALLPRNSAGFPGDSVRPGSLSWAVFPSVLSLERSEYYGNPKNHFWQIMEAALRDRSALPYQDRCQRLTREGVALWDVVRGCSREGSADSRIRNPLPNDIAGLSRHTHPSGSLP